MQLPTIKKFLQSVLQIFLLTVSLKTLTIDREITNPIAFAKKILHEWGYENIPVQSDFTSFSSRAGDEGIILGNEWSTFANNPDILKAILGHELMHILHHDAVYIKIIGTLLYCLYRAGTAFLLTQSAHTLVSYFFQEDQTSWFARQANSLINNLIPLTIPAIIAYFSHATIGQFAQFILTTDSLGLSLYIAIYALLIKTSSSLYEWAINKVIKLAQSIANFMNTPLLSAITYTVAPLALYIALKYLSLYTLRFIQRSFETAADSDSVRTFATGKGLIGFLQKIKELFPNEETASLTNFHPVPTERIAAIEAALN